MSSRLATRGVTRTFLTQWWDKSEGLARSDARAIAIVGDLHRRIPTRSDALRREVGGRARGERRAAGTALLSALRAVAAVAQGAAAVWTAGSLGGFELLAGVRRDPVGHGWLPRLAVLCPGRGSSA